MKRKMFFYSLQIKSYYGTALVLRKVHLKKLEKRMIPVACFSPQKSEFLFLLLGIHLKLKMAAYESNNKRNYFDEFIKKIKRKIDVKILPSLLFHVILAYEFIIGSCSTCARKDIKMKIKLQK